MNGRTCNFHLYYRLIALWIMAEIFIGGLIHALRLIGSGLIVGSAAVICMSLIALHYQQRGLIIKATIVVLLFKFTLSPQAPFTAYVAVLFQGVVGELIFYSRLSFKVKSYVVALLALLESGFQRILILTVVFGKSLWAAFDAFVQRLIPVDFMNYAALLILVYTAAHLVAGFLVGRWCAALPGRIADWKTNVLLLQPDRTDEGPIGKKKKRRPLVAVLWMVLLFVFAVQFFFPQYSMVGSNKLAKMLLRSAMIIGCWVLIVSPLVRILFKYFSRRGQTKYKAEIEAVSLLLPEMKGLMISAWRESAKFSSYRRLRYFAKLLVANVLA